MRIVQVRYIIEAYMFGEVETTLAGVAEQIDALYTSPIPDSLLLTDEEIKSIVYQWNSNGTRTSILFVALAGEKLVAKAQLAKVSPLIAKLEAENKRLNELIKALDGLLWKGVNLIDGEDEFKEESNDRK